MPTFDVVVIGAGLAGLTAGCELAEAGARVFVCGHGMAATHWAHGGVDVAGGAPGGTSRSGVAALARRPGHPYAMLAREVGPALAAHIARLAAAGLPYRGDLDTPLVPIPTAIGGWRPAAVLPAAQAAAARPWRSDERLMVLGFADFKDFWAAYMARNLARAPQESGPAAVHSRVVELPDLAQLRNLGPLDLARRFDDPAWRRRAIEALATARPTHGPWRVALPAVLGLVDHAEVHGELQRALGHPIIEIATVPPSIPGVRLFEALRRRLLDASGQIQVGFPVVRVERAGRVVRAVHTEAASRTHRLAADRFVLATGGIAGGGLRADPDGTIRETVFGLPVDAPPRAEWFSPDLGPHPLEAAGLRTTERLLPLDANGEPALENVHVAGSQLAGMRYLSERCGDGVALASAHRAAAAATGRSIRRTVARRRRRPTLVVEVSA